MPHYIWDLNRDPNSEDYPEGPALNPKPLQGHIRTTEKTVIPPEHKVYSAGCCRPKQLEGIHEAFMESLGFRGLGFRGLGFRGLGFRV